MTDAGTGHLLRCVGPTPRRSFQHGVFLQTGPLAVLAAGGGIMGNDIGKGWCEGCYSKKKRSTGRLFPAHRASFMQGGSRGPTVSTLRARGKSNHRPKSWELRRDDRKTSSSGVEPDLRPSQSRVLSLTLQGPIMLHYPTEESNLARLLRRQSCILHTRRAFH